MLRPIRYNKFGFTENPIGQIVLSEGRLYEVTGVYLREVPSTRMLTTKHFCGDPGPDVPALSVLLVLPDGPPEEVLSQHAHRWGEVARWAPR